MKLRVEATEAGLGSNKSRKGSSENQNLKPGRTLHKLPPNICLLRKEFELHCTVGQQLRWGVYTTKR